MRTTTEVVERLRAHYATNPILDFRPEVWAGFLSLDEVREFLNPDADISSWVPDTLDEPTVLAQMRSYMEFAWGKVEDHRGISAGRSVQKMGAWLWLLGDDELVAVTEDDSRYPMYGAPILKAICDKYGFPVPDSESIGRMAQGLTCTPDCENGCGR